MSPEKVCGMVSPSASCLAPLPVSDMFDCLSHAVPVTEIVSDNIAKDVYTVALGEAVPYIVMITIAVNAV